MPKLIYPEEFDTNITKNIRIGYREKGRRKIWYARFYWMTGNTHAYYSLKMEYEANKTSFKLADEAARKLYRNFESNVKKGAHYAMDLSLASMSARYLEEIRKRGEENDRLIKKGHLPKWNDHKNGYWSIKKYNKRATYHDQIKPFFANKWRKNIGDIELRFLNTFIDWALANKNWAPSSINYHITEIRQIWVWAFNQGYVDHVPTIKRAPQDLRKRSRKFLKESEWDRMIDWAAERYNERKAKPEIDPEATDLAYQFWLWLHVISYTGIRPPYGQVKKNLLRWDSYFIENKGTADEKRIFRRIDEKNHDYEAAIMPEAWDVFDLLEEHREHNGLKKTYLFQHTREKDGCWTKGDPILNFRTSWETMLRDLKLDMPKGTPQYQKLVPYCLRAYYITYRLRDGDMRIEDLAEAVGSSVQVLREMYYEFSTSRQYKSLTSGSHSDRTIRREREKGYAIL